MALASTRTGVAFTSSLSPQALLAGCGTRAAMFHTHTPVSIATDSRMNRLASVRIIFAALSRPAAMAWGWWFFYISRRI